ncbi:hypothetical protein [Rathayibacter iranicus]|uniref:DUF559 domain-containing protein n=2 Tax=Rathayibacter iranicus TaxID=59737 RepID=A0AAD1EMP0_9MICO|nr:hypothetical protein [Rathayibacter iranicus]AZZ56308.1 hypothetical protein C7V51_10760 [Rathayibacter iranicus]MWV32131.1 hypothetical protein [Rathayibacter iranicus NCPPB 2253 = VKM Ac-1602]PPI45511.1 hypothetical protein C5E09_09745 [Rathayibacter iranicus]PPI59331.1 hypothetical protein C5E08_10670 [Rathayibacter iranicus]PPI70618.1 hypothetical protein C5E01_09715 [Rathayibacter iranicus]
MHEPSALPAEFQDRAFTVAEARAGGLSRGRLRSSDLGRPFHGIRTADPDPALRLRAEALLTAAGPGAVLSHLTAACLWPLDLPPAAADEPLHICVRWPNRAPRHRNVVGHAVADPEVRRVVRRGLPVTDPASLFCHLAALLELDDLVAVGDALVRTPVVGDPADPRPWVPLPDLQARAAAFRGRGAVRLREAAALVRDGADSRPESRFRVASVRAGIPEPLLQVPLYDSAGRFVGRPDGWYPRERVAWEYEGDGHRTSNRQFARDLGRYDDLASIGVRVVRIVGAEFLPHPERAIERLRRALAERSPRR